MADALSLKKVVAYIMTLLKVILDFNERIKQAARLDAGNDKPTQAIPLMFKQAPYVQKRKALCSDGWIMERAVERDP